MLMKAMDIFTPLSPEQKQDFQKAFFAHLARRDGKPDAQGRTFDVREKMYAELRKSPVRRKGLIDPEVFARNLKRHQPEPGLDQRTLWALATAKANRGEAYGVDYQFKNGYFDVTSSTDPFLFIAIEEQYHTRVLRDALEIFDLEFEFEEPTALFQLFIKTLVKLPKSLSDVLVFCAEIAGAVSFRMLLDKARELFAGDPEALRHIERLMAQIVVDEVGHVYFLRSRLGPARLKLAKAMLPSLAKGLIENTPEGAALFGYDRLMQEILKADLDGLCAEFPDRFSWPSRPTAVAA